MAKAKFKKVAILGMGLIGGSLGMELRKRGLAKQVVAYNRSAKGRRLAVEKRACHRVYSRAQDAAKEADLIILAGPVSVIPQLAGEIAPYLKPGTIVTDVGSTKVVLGGEVRKRLPRGVHFIGGHPIAGTEQSGMEAAHLGLFSGRWWILTPESKARNYLAATRQLEVLLQGLGAKVAQMKPKNHDRVLALISHLPHMVAYALVQTALGVDRGAPLKYSAGGFRDFTRIAASSPEMWSDIGVDNGEEIVAMLERFEKALGQLKKLIQKKDKAGLRRAFTQAARARRKL